MQKFVWCIHEKVNFSLCKLFSLQGKGRGVKGFNTFRYQYINKHFFFSNGNISQRENKDLSFNNRIQMAPLSLKDNFGSKMRMAQLLQQPRAVSTDIQTGRQQPWGKLQMKMVFTDSRGPINIISNEILTECIHK